MTRVAIVHPSTLAGSELRERLAAAPASDWECSLLASSEEEVGQVTEVAGAAAFVGRVDEIAFDGIDLAFFCGPIESDRLAASHLPSTTPAVFLARGATLDDGQPAVAGVASTARAAAHRLISPHPATIAIALLLDALDRFGVRNAHATVLLPVTATEAGSIDDLLEETRRLLTFQSPSPKSRKQGQVAFNLTALGDPAAAIAGEVAAALGRAQPTLPVALQMVRAGIFHGLAVQLWVEIEKQTSLQQIRKALGSAPAIELARRPERLGPVAVAGAERLQVGAVQAGASSGHFGIWAAMDNLVRGGALNALELGRDLLADRPSA